MTLAVVTVDDMPESREDIVLGSAEIMKANRTASVC